MNTLKTFAALLFIGTLSAHSYADDAAKLIVKLQALSSMHANFTQQTINREGQVLQSLTGELTVAKPNKLRWQTQPPYEQLVISDGSSLWTYDQDLEQVSIRDVDQSSKETPALLLSGDSKQVTQNFTVNAKRTGKRAIFKLTPKDPSQLFESLEFSYQGTALSRIRIFDAAGQVTDIKLSEQHINIPIGEGDFIFQAPKGVDVIDGRRAR